MRSKAEPESNTFFPKSGRWWNPFEIQFHFKQATIRVVLFCWDNLQKKLLYEFAQTIYHTCCTKQNSCLKKLVNPELSKDVVERLLFETLFDFYPLENKKPGSLRQTSLRQFGSSGSDRVFHYVLFGYRWEIRKNKMRFFPSQDFETAKPFE